MMQRQAVGAGSDARVAHSCAAASVPLAPRAQPARWHAHMHAAQATGRTRAAAAVSTRGGDAGPLAVTPTPVHHASTHYATSSSAASTCEPPGDPSRSSFGRGLLAAAAAAVVLQAPLPAPYPTPAPPSHHEPAAAAVMAASASHPPRAQQLLLLAVQSAPPGSALAAEASPPPTGQAGGAAKMQALRSLAVPDTQHMRELSEELAAGPPPKGAKTVPAAAKGKGRGGDAAKDAAALQAKLKAADLASLLRVSDSQAKAILDGDRDLRRVTVASACEALEALRGVLGLPRGAGAAAGAGGAAAAGAAQREAAAAAAVGRVVAREPRLLLLRGPELRSRFGELQSLLAAPAPSVRRLLSSQPQLLLLDPAALSSRLSGLCAAFNVDPQLAAQLAAHEPSLLGLGAAEVAARAEALGAELKLTRAQLVAVLRRHPAALLPRERDMRARLAGLGAALGGPAGRPLPGSAVLAAPRLLVVEPQQAEAAVEAVATVLQVPRERARELAAAAPGLLAVPGGRAVLEERLGTLGELLKVPVKQARMLAQDRPWLLTKSSASMRRAVAEADAAEGQKQAEAVGQAQAAQQQGRR